jgi:hypothetical protein
MVALIEDAPGDAVFVRRSENKQVDSVRCRAASGVVRELYVGEPRDPSDTETIGIYKASTPRVLREWKRACAENRGVFAGVNLPLEVTDIAEVDMGAVMFHEVNDVLDFLNLIELRRGKPRGR